MNRAEEEKQRAEPREQGARRELIICSPLIAPEAETAAETLAARRRLEGADTQLARWLHPAQAKAELERARDSAALYLFLGDDGATPCLGAPWRPSPLPLSWWHPLIDVETEVYLYGAAIRGYAERLANLLQRPVRWSEEVEGAWRGSVARCLPYATPPAGPPIPRGPRGGQLAGPIAAQLLPQLERRGPLAKVFVLGAGDGALLDGLEPFVAYLLCVEGDPLARRECADRFAGCGVIEVAEDLDRLGPEAAGRFDLALLLDPLGPLPLDAQLALAERALGEEGTLLVAATVAGEARPRSLRERLSWPAPTPAERLRPAPGTPLPELPLCAAYLQSRLPAGEGAPCPLTSGVGQLYLMESDRRGGFALEPALIL